ncbi:class I SAM-dependent methyltransferase [Salinisphaera aquimarina]|uniref:Class I SAM-dependent methyltransferase n=1 Tax=Salinisphaera aquimarina TaxID=2094031 RepID=A0ABV7EIT3_9GAMM
MKFSDAARELAGIPHISRHSARVLYDFLLTEKPVDCLELGFAHGAGSGYIAAALDELGRGHLTSVDIELSRDFEPTIEHTLDRLGLPDRVSIQREINSYNWFLKKTIEAQTRDGQCTPCYDFVFIDGSKNWTIDGMAFFLADKLLRPGGWILFDDYNWRYADAVAKGKDASDGVSARELSPDQVEEPNVAAIFHLLVSQHPDYSNFRVQDQSWAWAQKVATGRKSITATRKSRLSSRLAYWRSRVMPGDGR